MLCGNFCALEVCVGLFPLNCFSFFKNVLLRWCRHNFLGRPNFGIWLVLGLYFLSCVASFQCCVHFAQIFKSLNKFVIIESFQLVGHDLLNFPLLVDIDKPLCRLISYQFSFVLEEYLDYFI